MSFFYADNESKDFREKFVWKKHVTSAGKEWIKNFENKSLWKRLTHGKKGFINLVHIHVRAPENGGITKWKYSRGRKRITHSRLIRFCLRRNTGGETC